LHTLQYRKKPNLLNKKKPVTKVIVTGFFIFSTV
jgi:hypothetical protein